jgi:hypothetical protein
MTPVAGKIKGWIHDAFSVPGSRLKCNSRAIVGL